MKIVFLIAAAADSRCGVGDYTAKLAEALRERGQDVVIERVGTWSLSAILALRKKYSGQKDVVFHLQYPSLGMGHSLTPALLPLLLPSSAVYVTLHEFSIFSKPRQLIFLSHAVLSKSMIFSNDYEKVAFRNALPFQRAALEIIPIGNNIEVVTPENGLAVPRRQRVIYFGQLGEDKGIDFFLSTVQALRGQNVDFEAAMIGAVMDHDTPLMKQVREYADLYNIELLFDRSSAEVSKELAQSKVAILPFPDGISDKRGSALACLEHGVKVVTKHSIKTPEWLKRTTTGIETPDECTATVKALLDSNFANEMAPETSLLEVEIARRKWPSIADEHLRLYRN